MQLKNSGREFYALKIEALTSEGAPVTAAEWEASFDDGETWVTCDVQTISAGAGIPDEWVGDWSVWLVAGPDAAVGSAVAVLTAEGVHPDVRLVDSPEIVVRTAPRIAVTQ